MPDPNAGSQIVVRKATTWERFGASMGESPLLSSFFDNPLFDRVLGETEIAQSCREMRALDSNFNVGAFVEEVEHVVAPHIVRNYLEGNADVLQMHCGEAAFAAVHTSIKERMKQKLTLDSSVLLAPHEVELKGAKPGDGGSPHFVFTFHTQQVNCLYDKDGEVVEGAVDDIRSVYYAIALTRHPWCDPDSDEGDVAELEYPWQVTELAVVGNQPTI